jgi:hypothetical protein
VDADAVYVGCDDGRVYALDTRSGDIRWAFATHDPDPDPEDALAGEEVHPEVSALCLDVGGRAYVGSDAGALYEVELATGRELRRWILPDLLTEVDDEPYIVALTLAGDHLVFAIGGGISQIFVVLDRRTAALSKMDYSPGPFSIRALTVYAGVAITLSTFNPQGKRTPSASSSPMRPPPSSSPPG